MATRVSTDNVDGDNVGDYQHCVRTKLHCSTEATISLAVVTPCKGKERIVPVYENWSFRILQYWRHFKCFLWLSLIVLIELLALLMAEMSS